MSIVPRSNDPIPYETGFPDPDPYGLKDKGKRLSNAFKGAEDPLVIAVDGPWGSGKSLFLKGWSKDHGLDARVIYFDAFKHDYLDDPLVSLVQAITEELPDTEKLPAMERIKKALPFVSRIGLRMASLGAQEEVNDFIDVAIKETSSEAEKLLEKLWAVETGRHKAMETFRSALKTLVEYEDTLPKLIFIVDELDRCRPDYALQMLEVMKHFFDVANVHFVLGANVEQLQHSVRARFGAGIAADKYLQRFVHATFDIRYRRGQRRFDGNIEEKQYFDSLDVRQDFPVISIILEGIPKSQSVTFRDMERLHSLCRVTSRIGRTDAHDILLDGLIVIKALRPSWIESILRGNIEPDEIAKLFHLEHHLLGEKNPELDGYEFFGSIWMAALGLKEWQTLPQNHQIVFGHPTPQTRYPVLAEIITRYLNGFEVR